MKPVLNPYLNFNGTTREAMKFYQSVLGGELTMQTFGETKMAETPKEKDLIVHAALKSGGLSIMASDTHPKQPPKVGDNVHLSLTGNDKNKLTKIFNGLSKGGKVDMPLAQQFWGDTFGKLTDKFGVHWMVDVASPGQK